MAQDSRPCGDVDTRLAVPWAFTRPNRRTIRVVPAPHGVRAANPNPRPCHGVGRVELPTVARPAVNRVIAVTPIPMLGARRRVDRLGVVWTRCESVDALPRTAVCRPDAAPVRGCARAKASRKCRSPVRCARCGPAAAAPRPRTHMARSRWSPSMVCTIRLLVSHVATPLYSKRPG